MSVDDQIARHYTSGNLLERIRTALAEMGADPDHPALDDLKPVDEFHIGGTGATRTLLAQMHLRAGQRVLDLGSGLGGPARLIASESGARVTGIDLTKEFVDTANALSAMTGMSERTHFVHGSALDLPFEAASFDAATLIHVGMNLPDKDALFSGVARVLKPGGIFMIYDVMRTGPGNLTYPVPWAETAATDFSVSPEAYRAAAATARIVCEPERSRSAEALEFFAAQRAAMDASNGPPPLGIHLLTGTTRREKVQNMTACIEAGIIAPVEMLCRKPG